MAQSNEDMMYPTGYMSYKDWTDGDLAAKLGYFDLMKSKKKRGEPMRYSVTATCNAAERGDLEMVRWLYEEGVACTSWTTRAAAMYGHTEVVKYLIELPIAYQPDTIDAAVEKGYFEVVKCLIEHKKTFTSMHIGMAERNGFLQIRDYLKEHMDLKVDFQC
jgi:hypothetical protein